MRFGSVCSGIDAASVAWNPLGWKAAFFSEIEKFPCAVLKHHYPNVPNYGDMTKFAEWPDEPIDLLVGGTPCQSFSVAGLRKGLDDPRGNLMLTFGAIAAKYRPTWLVWENVPGVLSSNGGRDFGTFLGMLAELGYGFAYRVLDAQFFGVAQRRRRVFVVGCLGDWRRAAAVLFERHSLSRNPAPSRKAREGVAASLERSVAGCLNSVGGHAVSGNSIQDADQGYLIPTFSIQGNLIGRDDGGPEGVGASEDGVMYTLTKADVHGVAQPIAFHNRQDPDVSGEVTHPIGAKDNGMAVGIDTYNHAITGDYAGSLTTTGGPPLSGPGVLQSMQVRRLTPTECERLQGFPDGYTNIPWRGKQAPDGPRYKALGNSMAVPVMRWIGQRIDQIARIK